MKSKLTGLIGLWSLGLFAVTIGALLFAYVFVHPLALTPNEALTESGHLVLQFTETNQASLTLNLEELKRTRESAELIDPKTALPDFSSLNRDELATLRLINQNCKSTEILKILKNKKISKSLQKQLIWEHYRCGLLKELPVDFFSTSPYMSLNGESYFVLSGQSGPSPNKHLLEILNSDDLVLGGLMIEPSESEQLNANPEIFLTQKWLWVQKRQRDSEGRYSVFDRTSFEHFLKGTFVQALENESGQNCLILTGNICWNIDQRSRDHYSRLATLFLLGGVILLFIAILRQRRNDIAERAMVLKLLTHELRTPVTSISLWMETIRSDVESLPMAFQKPWSSILIEVQRMKRLLEKSAWFLRAQEQQSTSSAFELQKLNLTGWLKSYLDLNYPGVSRDGDQWNKETIVEVDTYWLSIIFKNLIENALQHGKPPVAIKMVISKNIVEVVIEDKGEIELKRNLFQTFPIKKDQSKGLGIGISIVRKVAAMMKVKLVYQSHPTRVSLRFKNL